MYTDDNSELVPLSQNQLAVYHYSKLHVLIINIVLTVNCLVIFLSILMQKLPSTRLYFNFFLKLDKLTDRIIEMKDFEATLKAKRIAEIEEEWPEALPSLGEPCPQILVLEETRLVEDR